ncbi:hypothetical protein QBC38DRAFT_491916 [Podospora fimiseda]|uniref:Apple domain-containing protein n=1 Tax=Podospora fimiseda TaxID=252190 RepID=A0AAN6YLV5_9PEZI|nr:hypothetical protein QBC38DRAFT_491916 [Podospora fimiseda]
MDRLAADSGPRDSGSTPGPAGWRQSTQLPSQQNHQRNSSSATVPGSSSNNNGGYHDGLILTDGIRNSVNYPEVVPSEFAAAAAAAALPQSGRNSPAINQEKTYPEVNTQAPSIHLEKNYPEVASSTHNSHSGSHHPHRYSGATATTHPRPTPSPAPTTVLSTVHSVHAGAVTRTSLHAWSEAGEDRYQETIPADGKPLQKVKKLWKKPIVWVVFGAVVIIVVLAGILGAIATGKIKTSGTKYSSQTETAPSTQGSQVTISVSNNPSTGAGVVLSCPSANNVNFTAERTGPGNGKIFRRQCGVNFVGGDGTLGKTNGTAGAGSLTECLEECAERDQCAGAVWMGKANGGPECWLKEFVGVGRREDVSGLEAGVLWQ